MMQAKLNILAYTKGKDQPKAMDVEETRFIANVRMHIVVAVRQRYRIYCVEGYQYT